MVINKDVYKEGKRVAAVVYRDDTKCVRLYQTQQASSELNYALLLEIDVYGPTLRIKEFCNLFRFYKFAVYQWL